MYFMIHTCASLVVYLWMRRIIVPSAYFAIFPVSISFLISIFGWSVKWACKLAKLLNNHLTSECLHERFSRLPYERLICTRPHNFPEWPSPMLTQNTHAKKNGKRLTTSISIQDSRMKNPSGLLKQDAIVSATSCLEPTRRCPGKAAAYVRLRQHETFSPEIEKRINFPLHHDLQLCLCRTP